jgi:phage-related minor tail protein
MEAQYSQKIKEAKLNETKQSIVSWQAELSDSLSLALLDIGLFGDKAAVILGELSAQFIELSASAALSGFEEFGRALGEGENAADSLKRALAAMAQQILRQLPMMFLQAGLQLIANGQWALGLGFIAAAASSALISGYVDGTINKAKKDAQKEEEKSTEQAEKNAQGGVYEQYGKAAAAFAQGGVFTNRVIAAPTYFRFAAGGGFASGLMGEAGPEAIVPLERGPDGRLGVSAFGGALRPAVYVIIQNYTNEDAQSEQSFDSSGNEIQKVIIGAVKHSITSGDLDRPMSSRYGLRARGV